MSPRNLFRIGVAVAALGWFGWSWYRAHHPGDAPAKPSATRAADAPPAKPRMYGRIAFHPCTLAPQYGAMSVEAQCGTLSVPEDRAKPDGRKLALAIAWVPAGDNGDVAPDPVFMLAGGPGQSARDSYPQVAAAFAEVLKHRNVVLVDQRRLQLRGCKRCQCALLEWFIDGCRCLGWRNLHGRRFAKIIGQGINRRNQHDHEHGDVFPERITIHGGTLKKKRTMRATPQLSMRARHQQESMRCLQTARQAPFAKGMRQPSEANGSFGQNLGNGRFLHQNFDILGNLQLHVAIFDAADFAHQAAGGDHFIASREVVEQIAQLFLFFHLRAHHEEKAHHKHQNHGGNLRKGCHKTAIVGASRCALRIGITDKSEHGNSSQKKKGA